MCNDREGVMRLFLSFSGGETSAMMCQLPFVKNYREVVTLFANTGQENEETLQFVDRCDKQFGLNVVWLEAEINKGKGNGTTHRIVDFKSADRSGMKSFAPMCEKYGIPNRSMPHCTRELKTSPMYSYIRSIGWEKGSYDVAIGIRADEIDRMSPSAKSNRIIYPMVKAGIKKPDVNIFWSQMPFRLNLRGYQGNCKWCWKKSFRKLVTIARENPDAFSFPAYAEKKFSMCGAMAQRHNQEQKFFQGQRSVIDIIEMAKDKSIVDAKDDSIVYPDPQFDFTDGCSESCEINHEET
jgi:hypothetical protein